MKELDSKAIFLNESWEYALVLVYDHNHWIAVKRRPENKGFLVYDPATGECNKVDNVNDLTEYLTGIDSNVGDLVITLK